MALDAEEVYGALFKKATGAATYAEQARTYATTAAEIFEDIKDVAETIPEDYTELSNRVSDLTKVYDFTDLASLKVGTDIFPGDRVKFRYSPQNGQTIFMWSKNDGTFGMVNAKSGGSTEKDTIIFEVTDEYKAIGPKPNSFTFFEVTSTRPVDVTEIEQSLEKKMEYFKVTATGAEDNLTIRHDGVAMTYEQLKDIYLNDKYFLYAEHYDLTMIPSLPPLDYDPILEFICTWMYQGETRISRLIINGENHAKFETVVVPSKESVDILTEDVSALKNTKADKSDLAITDRKADVALELAKGVTYRYEDKTETGMNVAPSGAMNSTLISVDGNTEQEITNGYQLFNLSDIKDNDNVSVNIENTTVKVTSKINSSSGYVSANVIILNGDFADKDIYLYTEINTSDNGCLSIRPYDEAGKEIAGNRLDKTGSGLAYKRMPSNTAYLSVVPYAKYSGGAATVGMYTEYTNTIISLHPISGYSDYEPYTGGQPSPSPDYPQEIQGTERLDFKVFDKLTEPIEYLKNLAIRVETGEFYYNAALPWRRLYVFKLDANTDYKILNDGNLARMVISNKYPKDGESGTVIDDAYFTELKIDAATNERYLACNLLSVTDYESGMTYKERLKNLKVIASETFTITPPHTMYKIDDYADKLDVEKGVYEWNCKTKKIIASSIATIGESIDNTTLFNLSGNNALLDIIETAPYTEPYLCNFFTSQTTRINTSVIGSYVYNKTLRCRVCNKIASTAQEFEDWIKNNDLYVIYPTDNIQSEPIPQADLDLLNQLRLLPSDYTVEVTDQLGRDVTYILKYMVDLREV